MTGTAFALRALLTGGIGPLGPRGVPSGIAKRAVSGPLSLTASGFVSDAQGDTARHGGPEKAVHHYPFEHYRAWSEEIGPHVLLNRPGAFGENLSTLGLTEDTVAVGDVFAIGTARIEVSQGRQPCWRLNERFGNPKMARLVQSTGRTGWYYRVIEAGRVEPGDRLTLVDRHSPDWTIARIWRAFYVDTLNRDELAGLAGLVRLAGGWRDLAAKRLRTDAVEDWTRRLSG